MPFHTGYTELMRKRARALFSAYFADSVETLRTFRDREHVTHLLVDRRHFRTRPTYFAPFDPDVARAFDAGKQHGFAALELVPRLHVAEAGSYVLLDLSGV